MQKKQVQDVIIFHFIYESNMYEFYLRGMMGRFKFYDACVSQVKNHLQYEIQPISIKKVTLAS